MTATRVWSNATSMIESSSNFHTTTTTAKPFKNFIEEECQGRQAVIVDYMSFYLTVDLTTEFNAEFTLPCCDYYIFSL